MANKAVGNQHGDVLIKKVDFIPSGAVKQERNGDLMVMHGETLGHRHMIKDKGAVAYEFKGQLYIEVTEPVTITHEEHLPQTIPIGKYLVGQVREHDYLEDVERRVED